MTFTKYPIYSSCTPKKKYSDIIAASDAGKMQMYDRNYEVELYIYQCEHCQQYHLTQQVTDIPCLK